MAIGTTAAILGAAAIGGGTALIGGAQQSRAADRSARAVQNASDQSSATQRYIFDTTRSDTATQRAAGNAATAQLARLMNLNLGPAQAQQPGQPQVLPAAPGNALQNGPATLNGGKSGMGPMYVRANDLPGPTIMGEGGQTYGGVQSGISGGALTSGRTGQTQTLGGGVNPSSPGSTTPAEPQSQTAWLRSLPGYQFNFDEGARAANHSLASRGQLFSGDAGRELTRYGQNYGDRIYNQERNALFSLAGLGQVSQGQANSAGQNYANNQTAINTNNANALGSSYQNSANAWTNALGGVAGAGMWGLNQLR